LIITASSLTGIFLSGCWRFLYQRLDQELIHTELKGERWIQKKAAQFYNSRYNEILNYGLEGDEEA
jgi:hypothetical protein